MNKYLFLIFLVFTSVYSMPDTIQDFQEITIPTANASKMKDIISPTKDILSKADEIYQNEKKDFESTVKIEKFRNIKSMNQNFLVNKQLQLSNILIDITSIDKTITEKPLINIKKKIKNENK